MPHITLDLIKTCLLGIACADMIGTEYEFMNREDVCELDTIEPKGYSGYHQQPLGAFSDDTSLTMCLAESLCYGFNLDDLASRFCSWLYDGGYWTSHGVVFDAGIATRNSIQRLRQGVRPDLAGELDEHSCGNGSLMRVLPLLFYIHDMPIQERFRITKLVSALTHAHIRCAIACFYYLEFCRQLLTEADKHVAYSNTNKLVSEYLKGSSINPSEIALFDRVLNGSIHHLHVNEISSTGYVLDTLEASLWCFLTTNSYEQACIAAIRLGNDTDTTAAVTSGLATLHNKSIDCIPLSWLASLARRDDIEDLAKRLFTGLVS